MVRYIKANPKVVDFLHLKESRNQLKDGNYILWQGDMLAFGPLTQLNDILTQIGAIALTSHEARQEQDGSILRPLPTATDPRFVVETAQNSPVSDPEAPKVETEAPESESPSEGTDEAPAGESGEQSGEAPENTETKEEE